MHPRNLLLLALTLCISACSTPKPLPAYEKPLARARFQTVRTTAYTHTESDHIAYGNKSALGTPLRCGPSIHSAAADWARWPAGTIFRLCSTGEPYFVDDYGWALTGRNTIDLYKPTKSAMNAWGLRREQIEILKWGDPWVSYRKMKPAAKYRHIAQMMRDINRFYSPGSGSPRPASSSSTDLVALSLQQPNR